jgi:hypothetical protein
MPKKRDPERTYLLALLELYERREARREAREAAALQAPAQDIEIQTPARQ